MKIEIAPQPHSQESWRWNWIKRKESDAVWAAVRITPVGILTYRDEIISWQDLLEDWECSENLYGPFRSAYR